MAPAVVSGHDEHVAYELTRGKLQAAKAALPEIDQMSRVYNTNPEVLSRLRSEYGRKVERDSALLDKLYLDRQQLFAEELQRARRHLQSVEKDAVIEASQRGLLGQAVRDKLLADIDAQLLRLESTESDIDDEQKPPVARIDEHAMADKSGAQEIIGRTAGN